MTQTTPGEIEFVNDWEPLEQALEVLADWKSFGQNDSLTLSMEEATNTLLQYVPRLLTQYAKLVELSFALTEGWEQYATLQGPSGLYLPDHR